MAQVKVPKDPRERNAWIKYQLELNGSSFAKISREYGVSRTVVRRALAIKYPKWERVIAAEIKVPAEVVWPERYAA